MKKMRKCRRRAESLQVNKTHFRLNVMIERDYFVRPDLISNPAIYVLNEGVTHCSLKVADHDLV